MMKQQAFLPHILSDNHHKESLKAMNFKEKLIPNWSLGMPKVKLSLYRPLKRKELTTCTGLSGISSDSAKAVVRPQLDGTAWQRNRGRQIRKSFNLLDWILAAVCANKFCCQTTLTPAIPLRSLRFFIPGQQTYMQTQSVPIFTHLYLEGSTEAKNFPSRDDSPLGMCCGKPECSCKIKLLVFSYIIHQFLPHRRISIHT